MSIGNEAGTQQITIILHSGSYDRVTNALSLAIVGLTMGFEVHLFLTYEGLKRFVKGHFEDVEGTDGELQEMIQRGIASGNIHAIEDKLAVARDLGLKLYACTTAMGTMGIAREDLVDEVDEVMGLPTFIQIARTASINWYI